VKRIAMPRHGLAGSKMQSANHGVSMMKEDFIRHR
jgi:hypothetical protein